LFGGQVGEQAGLRRGRVKGSSIGFSHISNRFRLKPGFFLDIKTTTCPERDALGKGRGNILLHSA